MENDNQNRNLYQRLDDSIMRGVNAGVRAWNWTTGRTKGDLALSCLYGAAWAAGLTIGVTNTDNPASAAVAGTIMSAVAHTVQWALWGNEMKIMDEKEAKVSEKDTLSLEVERYKKKCAFNGPVYTALGGTLYFTNSQTLASLPRDIMLGSTGASFYIMRADYLPPRKDCVRRGIEKLSEKLKNIQLPTIPNPIPQPIPVGVNYQVI